MTVVVFLIVDCIAWHGFGVWRRETLIAFFFIESGACFALQHLYSLKEEEEEPFNLVFNKP
jgi:hypothetical protein